MKNFKLLFLLLYVASSVFKLNAQTLDTPPSEGCYVANHYNDLYCDNGLAYGYTNPCSVAAGYDCIFTNPIDLGFPFYSSLGVSYVSDSESLGDFYPCYGPQISTDTDADGFCECDAKDDIIAGFSSPSSYYWWSESCESLGCTDPNACNYQSWATENDGSCEYTSCSDECGVPNGLGSYNYYIDNDSDGLGEGDLITTCVDLAQHYCENISVSGGAYASEVSWNIQNSSGETVVSGGAPYSEEVCLSTGSYIVNMIDNYGDGWNGANLSYNGSNFTFSTGYSSIDSLSIASYVTNGNDVCLNDPVNDPDGDGVCSINEVLGCDDTGACNFNEEATETDNTCDYISCADECGVINGSGLYNYYIDNDLDGLGEGDLITTCVDLAQQYCENISVSGGAYASEVSWNIQNSSGQTVASGGAPYSEEVCLSTGSYIVNMIDNYGDGWNGANLSYNGSNFTFSTGYSSTGSLSIASYVTNGNDVCLNDPENDPDGDGICSINEVLGCEDTGACNFNLEATEYDGTCEYTSCLDECDIINGDNSSCTDVCGVINGSGYYNYYLDTDSDGLGEGDVLSSCTDLTQSINVGTQSSYVLIGGDIEITGCVNELADNFMSSANTDDGSCLFSGCTSNWADNFSALANLDDGTCYLYGCIFNWADNYNNIATIDNGSCDRLGCIYEWANNFDSFATTDDSTCYLMGCTSDWADNFDPIATTDDQSCDRLGCVFDWADNFDVLATSDDSSCYRFGCISDWADNFDPIATQTDSSCVRLGCMSNWADNFDPIATQTDSSCVRLGCMSNWADNLDVLATSDDSSCYRVGCMLEWADNYDAIATVDVSSEFDLMTFSTEILPTNSDGSVVVNSNSFEIHGINEGNGLPNGTNQTLTIPIDRSGSYSFDWQHTDYDLDGAFYAVNFDPTTLINFYNSTDIVVLAQNGTGETVSGSEVWNGTVEIYLSEGDEITFGVFGEDLCCGIGVLTVDDFVILDNEQGSCFRNGCTDPLACNYDLLATIDDGNCGTILTLNSSQSEYYCSDYSWTLSDDENLNIAEGICDNNLEVCISQGDYILSSYNTIDSEWWPSWTYVLIEEMDSVTTLNDSGNYTEDSLILYFTVEFGCIDEQAKNYSSSATVDDGSCHYGSCMDPNACNYDETANEDDGSCIYIENECQVCQFVHNHYELIENDDDLDGICNEDDIAGCTNELSCNYDPFATEDDGSCIAADACVDCELAIIGIYLTNDSDNDGICDEDEEDGCTDDSACDFNPSATENDGSCTYPEEGFDCEDNCVSETALPLTFGGGSWISEASFDIIDCTNNSIISGAGQEIIYACIELPDNYTIYLNDSYGDGWNGNQLHIGDSLYELLVGSLAVFDYGCIIPGCIDTLACTFESTSTVDDGSCEYPLVNYNCDGTPVDLNANAIPDSLESSGCIEDVLACNFNPNAELEQITYNNPFLCEYPPSGYDCSGNCEATIYTLKMMDSYGDGWNGNSISIDGGDPYTFNNGSEQLVELCIDTNYCYQIQFSVGSYVNEVSWSIYDQNGDPISDDADPQNVLEAQGAYFSATQGAVYNGNFGSCNQISGCTEETANNYNENAELDDGSCILPVYGCTDVSADNFDSQANIEDQSCLFSGCTIQFATNYNPLVTIEDGSCIIAVYGCMNPQADNYNPLANTDDGECITSGICQYETLVVYLNDSYGDGWSGNILSVDSYSLTLEHNSQTFTTFFGTDTICINMDYCNTITVNGGSWANEVSWSIETFTHHQVINGNAPFIGTFGNCESDSNNVVIIDGCMESIANNYDPYATIQNQAICVYSSNYDQTEDVGCDDVLAINYNPGAQEFNNSNCIYYGCTSTNAQNYNQLATFDDGSCFAEGCAPGSVLDCDGSEDCHPINWIGDNLGDCADQEWGADLSCYQNDGGDCGGFEPEWNDDSFVITNWDLWCENELSNGCYVCDNQYVANNCAVECADFGCNLGSDIVGCIDSLSVNYNPLATINNGSCLEGTYGCTSESACNYNYSAIIDDSSCVFALEGMDCDDIVNYNIQQSDLYSNQPYVLKEGICNIESYFLVADDFYMKGVNYGDITSEDGMFFEFEHVSSPSEELQILFGDTVYIKINNLYVSSNLNLVALTAEVNKAIKVVVTPKIDSYIGLKVTSFDKFNIVGLFDNSSIAHKYLDRRVSDNIYSWNEEYVFGSFKASSYLDYSEVNCGCTNPLALNFDISATENNNSCAIEGCMDPYNVLFDPIANVAGSCDYLIEGCVYEWAFNYDPNANLDNASCVTFEYGCIDSLYLDFDSLANTSNGSCLNLIVEGCTDSLYLDYWLYNQATMAITSPFVLANTDNGTCLNPIIYGCTDFTYIEYNDSTNVEDLSLCETLKLFGCTDSIYTEYDALANTENNSCDIEKIFGCVDSLYLDFNQIANTDDGSCLSLIFTGCMDIDFTEYSSAFNVSDTTCVTPVVFGCTNSMFVEFNPLANTDNGNCANYLVTGCGNPSALNYILGVTNNDNSLCVFEEIYGCTNFISFNYDAYADIDDGSCFDVIMGCMYDLAFNFNPIANTDNGSCILVNLGCLDDTMFNYSPNVNTDDGSCYAIDEGCMDPFMLNYDSLANTNDDSCIPAYQGCTDSNMLNFDIDANLDNGSCIPIVQGCINALYIEYNPEANSDNESCTILISVGCTDALYIQYDELANINDGSCLELIINGCTDELYLEFNYIANLDDGTCYELLIEGCTNQLMYNYNELANIDDGSCYMLIEGCSDPSYFEFDSNVNSDNGTCIELIVLGCMDDEFIEYNVEANLDDNSCSDIVIPGCTNSLYLEYDAFANINNGSCQVLVVLGCMDASMYNYYESANTDDGSCFTLSSFTLSPLDYQFNMSITAQIEQTQGVFSNDLNDSIILISSVTNEVSGFATLELVPFGVNNYYAFITAYSNNLSDNLIIYVASSAIEAGFQIVDTLEFIPNSMLGSISSPWIFSLISSDGNYGCTNVNAVNYNSNASINNGTCIIPGCINSDYVEFDFEANLDNGSCSLTWQDAYLNQMTDVILIESQMTSLTDSLNQANLSIVNLQSVISSNTNSEDVVNLFLIDSLEQELLALQNASELISSSLIDYYIDFPQGWSLFGFNCFESISCENAFSSVSSDVIIVKDENGYTFLPEYNYNGIGDLIYSEGYQIKTTEIINQFQFCKVLISEE